MVLTKEQRDKLPASEFAVPGQRKLPIHDKQHVVLAWSAADSLKGDERSNAKRAVLRKAHALGVDTATWHMQNATLEARSIDFGDIQDHPNRLPFSGVLAFVDEPSDRPVGGAGGKRVIMTRAAAEAALDTLLGMAVDFKPDFDGHDATRKIGIITGDEIVDNEIRITGYFWAADFPEEVALMKKDMNKLGFSYECRSIVQSHSADPLVVVACEYTGAAVLYKDKAAYMKTSLAARADQETHMDKELQDALAAMATSIAGIPAAVGTAVTTALKASGDEDKKTKIDAAKATAATLRSTAVSLKASSPAAAATLEAEAAHIESHVARNEVPPPFVPGVVSQPHSTQTTDLAAAIATAMKPMTDAVGSLATGFADLKVKVENTSKSEPARKTLSAGAQALVSKVGIDLGDGTKKITVAQLDAAAATAKLQSHESMALKIALQAAGHLDGTA